MSNLLLDVRVEQPGADVAVVSFTGEHDLFTRDEIRDLLGELVGQHQTVVVDFSEAAFVDAAVLAVLRDVSRRAQAHGTVFRLQFGTAAIVRRSFEASGVLQELECFPSREAALEGGAPQPSHTVAS